MIFAPVKLCTVKLCHRAFECVDERLPRQDSTFHALGELVDSAKNLQLHGEIRSGAVLCELAEVGDRKSVV